MVVTSGDQHTITSTSRFADQVPRERLLRFCTDQIQYFPVQITRNLFWDEIKICALAASTAAPSPKPLDIWRHANIDACG